MYTYRIEQAIRAASVLHYEQKRRGSIPYPYITHLLSVAFILQEYTDNEDVIIASLLHDTLEDTDYTEKELKSDFGEKVCNLVKTVTEPKEEKGKKLSWAQRKQAYANQIKKGSKEAGMIAAVDKIHNFRSIIEEYYDKHDLFIRDFGGTLSDRLEVYQVIANNINKVVDGPLLAEFNHVFKQFKEFIFLVQQNFENK